MSTITGQAQARRVAKVLRETQPILTRELRAGVRDAIKPLDREIHGEVPRVVPAGYAPVLARAVKVSPRTSLLTAGGIEVAVRVSAKGRKEERDVRSINAGRLRHPLFGMRTRIDEKTGEEIGTWYDTRVRRGFVDRPIRALGGRLARDIEDAVDRVREKLERA